MRCTARKQSAPIIDTLSPEAPGWLFPLLSLKFFQSCSRHGASGKSECNMYCITCRSNALCSVCTPEHREHTVVQVRRSSYHDVIRINELQKLLDVSGVQTYIINSARVVFLNERPQPRPAKGVTNQCTTCERSLLDTFRYCSLGCKLAGRRRGDDVTFFLPNAKYDANASSGEHSGAELEDLSSSSKREKTKRSSGSSTPTSPPRQTASEPEVSAENEIAEDDETSARRRSLPGVSTALMQSLNSDMSPRTPPPTTTLRTAKRRKGMPHRAPIF